VPKQRMKKVMTKLMKLMRPLLKRPNKSRVEMRRLIQNSTKLRKRTSQLPPKLTHLPRQSPLSKRNLRLPIRKSSKKPLTPPSKRPKSLRSPSKK
jgi:hypothetical protein